MVFALVVDNAETNKLNCIKFYEIHSILLHILVLPDLQLLTTNITAIRLVRLFVVGSCVIKSVFKQYLN